MMELYIYLDENKSLKELISLQKRIINNDGESEVILLSSSSTVKLKASFKYITLEKLNSIVEDFKINNLSVYFQEIEE